MQGEYEHDETRSGAEGEEAVVSSSRPTRIEVYRLTVQCDPVDPAIAGNESCITRRTPLDFPLARKHRIDSEVTVKGSIPSVSDHRTDCGD